MANPQSPNPKTGNTEQELLNLSWDKDFNVNAIELLGYDSGSGVLRRLAVDSTGKIQTSGGGGGGITGSGVANQVTYWTGTAAIGGSTKFTFNPAIPDNNTDQTVVALTQSMASTSLDIGVDVKLLSSVLTVDGSIITTGNDGSTYETATLNNLVVSQDVNNLSGAILSSTYYGNNNAVTSSGTVTIKGSSDTNVSYIASNNTVNLNSLITPIDADSPNIFVCGSYNVGSAQVTNLSSGVPYYKYTGVFGIGYRGGGAVPDVAVGGEFSGNGGTANYGVIATGSTAALQAAGHILPISNNLYTLGNTSLRMSKLWSVDANFSGQTVMPTTGTSAGLIIGGASQFYESTATSGSGNTLVNPVVSFRLGNMAIAAPTHTSTTANESGLSVIKAFTPGAASSGRMWGLNFNVSANGSQNMTDSTSAVVGVEGTVSNNNTATVTKMSCAIFFNAHAASSTTSEFSAIDAYGGDASGNGSTGATITKSVALIAHMGRASGAGTITNHWGVRTAFNVISGTGAVTNQYFLGYDTSTTMSSFTANSQTRVWLDIPDMPSVGSFTSTVSNGIRFSTATRATRNGIAYGTTSYIWESAAGTVKLSGNSADTTTTSLLVSGAANSGVFTLTDGATPALDASLGNTFLLTAAGDRTIAIPTNPVSGQRIIIVHKASGAIRTLSLNTGTGGFRFGTTITALSATASGLTDYIGCIYNSADNKWDVVAYDKGH